MVALQIVEDVEEVGYIDLLFSINRGLQEQISKPTSENFFINSGCYDLTRKFSKSLNWHFSKKRLSSSLDSRISSAMAEVLYQVQLIGRALSIISHLLERAEEASSNKEECLHSLPYMPALAKHMKNLDIHIDSAKLDDIFLFKARVICSMQIEPNRFCRFISASLKEANPSHALQVACKDRHRQRYDKGCRLVVGCVPYRYTGESKEILEVLLVTPCKGGGLLFPKGGWENVESIKDAARRETLEEAGVEGNIMEDLGYWYYRSRGHADEHSSKGSRKVTMFALLVTKILDPWLENDVRQRKWVTVTEARRFLRDGWMREALEKFCLSRELPSPLSVSVDDSESSLSLSLFSDEDPSEQSAKSLISLQNSRDEVHTNERARHLQEDVGAMPSEATYHNSPPSKPYYDKSLTPPSYIPALIHKPTPIQRPPVITMKELVCAFAELAGRHRVYTIDNYEGHVFFHKQLSTVESYDEKEKYAMITCNAEIKSGKEKEDEGEEKVKEKGFSQWQGTTYKSLRAVTVEVSKDVYHGLKELIDSPTSSNIKFLRVLLLTKDINFLITSTSQMKIQELQGKVVFPLISRLHKFELERTQFEAVYKVVREMHRSRSEVEPDFEVVWIVIHGKATRAQQVKALATGPQDCAGRKAIHRAYKTSFNGSFDPSSPSWRSLSGAQKSIVLLVKVTYPCIAIKTHSSVYC